MITTHSELPTVLVVDDDSAIRYVLSSFLARAGYNVRNAADGAEALADIRECCPQVVVLDLDMPVLPGAELLQLMRRDAQLCDVPVILMTGLIYIPKPVQALAQGVLEKPFMFAELLAAIREVVPALARTA
jgi:CheY-like chemotaxis protein